MRAGYTLVELFLTIGVLVLVLGLAVNWANRLRQGSLEREARERLRHLTAAIERYRAEHGGRLPEVTPLVESVQPAPATDAAMRGVEASLQAAARSNGEDVRRALRWPTAASPALDPICDPWGTPIALMPSQNPLIGMAPSDDFFFVSAGPDRQFLTRSDNLYSYDYADAGTPTAAVGTRVAVPTTNSAGATVSPGGQRE